MSLSTLALTSALLLAGAASAVPVQANKASISLERRWDYLKYFDFQAHRGGRGEIVESTLPAFSSSLETGVTTLEFDLGLTSDGHLIVWHDEVIVTEKCQDTTGDFVGKNIANLTLAEIKTLDCGSTRIAGFPLQLEFPGTKLSTLEELFDFVDCATDEPVLYNIETKVNPVQLNQTRAPQDFVDAFVKVLEPRGEAFIDRVTHQSFDWRAVVYSKEVAPTLRTSALCDATTLYPYTNGTIPGNLTVHETGPSVWLNNIDIDSFNGSTVFERVAQAAHSTGANYLSPAGAAGSIADPKVEGFVAFTTPDMVAMAHSLDMRVATWTANGLNLIEYLVDDCKVDGVITDYPKVVRRWAEQKGLTVPPTGNVKRIQQCFAKHHQTI